VRAQSGLTAKACGAGYFLYAGGRGEKDGFGGGANGAVYRLMYDGSACTALGLAVGRVNFKFHMWAVPPTATKIAGRHYRPVVMGTLEIKTAEGTTVWRRSGDQGDVWLDAEANVLSPAFSVECAHDLCTRAH
jgi:hypothetical protein